MKNINIHLIQDQSLLSRYKSRSKYNTLPSFINTLYQEDYAVGNPGWIVILEFLAKFIRQSDGNSSLECFYRGRFETQPDSILQRQTQFVMRRTGYGGMEELAYIHGDLDMFSLHVQCLDLALE